MSGINTLLDTLLHQVLGKRVETVSRERQIQPVKPIDAAQGVQAVRSDARMNQHAVPPYTPIAQLKAGENWSGLVGSHDPVDNVHLSRVAQYISAIRAEPAVSASIGLPKGAIATSGAEASEVALLLKNNIVFSGLFYESHLAAWHRGLREKSLLQQEPQMRLWQDSRRTESGGSKELQALVARQLDALTTNKLIWQGELWPGIATEIEVRPRLEEQIPLPPGAATVPEQPTDWDLKVSLSMETLGPVILLCKVSGSSLQLEVRAASQTAADRIAAAVNTLKSKFQTTGFQQVRVKVVVEE